MNSILVLTNKNHFLFVLGSTCKCEIMFNVFQGNHGANVSRIFCKYEYERNTNRIAFFLVFFAILFNSYFRNLETGQREDFAAFFRDQ